MFGLSDIVTMAAIAAVVAVGTTFGLITLTAGMARKRRVFLAALVAGFLPVSIPAISLLNAGDWGPDMLAPLGVIALYGIALMLVIGFPIAYVVSKGRANDPPTDLDIFE